LIFLWHEERIEDVAEGFNAEAEQAVFSGLSHAKAILFWTSFSKHGFSFLEFGARSCSTP
jgi:hypothetical protein